MSGNYSKLNNKELIRVLETAVTDNYNTFINHIVPVVKNRLSDGGKVITCGNGGSACTASHLTEELLGKFQKTRPPLASICLNSDSPTLTCISNDFLYNYVFSRQLEALGKKNDVLIVFSTSGNSINIINALTMAQNLGITTISFLGKDGGLCHDPSYSDYSIVVKSQNSARIQEVHEFFMHSLLELIENDYP
jgi:D-sedoheptulose 7-phosphate isomerase